MPFGRVGVAVLVGFVGAVTIDFEDEVELAYACLVGWGVLRDPGNEVALVGFAGVHPDQAYLFGLAKGFGLLRRRDREVGDAEFGKGFLNGS